MDHVDALVVGAGVVGLAVARALAMQGLGVVIAEAATAIGTGTSSRNSEVVHAGLYYEPGSLKARLCLRGRELLYRYCEARAIAHRRCGKLVVATRGEDEPRLQALAARGTANGVEGLRLLARREALAMEPALACSAALWSPASGIVDSHGLMTALLGDAEGAGALLALASPVTGARRHGGDWIVRTGGDEPFELAARWLVNAAGLHANRLALAMDGFAPAQVPRLWLAQGRYCSLAGRAPFSRLIYPLPADGGLGIHLTLDLGGEAKFGPDVRWLPHAEPDAVDYRVEAGIVAGFDADVRRYWPALPDGALQPAYSGVRPKLSGPGEPAADFRIAGPAQHGCDGVVQLFGIESPGLTAALAIGEHVAALVADHER